MIYDIRNFQLYMSCGDVKTAITLLESDELSGAPMSLDAPLVLKNPLWTVCDGNIQKDNQRILLLSSHLGMWGEILFIDF